MKKMTENQQFNRKKQTNPQPLRPTIGFLTTALVSSFEHLIWTGVVDAAREQGVNLICFAGRQLRSRQGFEAQGNVLYELIDAGNVDGLVIWCGGLGNFTGLEGMRNLCERYRPLPLVSIGMALDAIPSVLVNNYQSMREAMVHLVEVHGYRRLAFVGGPEGHPEAEERYRAYRDVLAEYSLSFEPNLIAPGTFTGGVEAGRAAVSLLLDERELLPQVDFQAVAVANDDMAFGVLEELQGRGISVSDDVAVVGFDDIGPARFSMPPLTTVRQPIHELGRQGIEMVLAQLAGEEVPEQVIMPMELVVRQSCGCLGPTVVHATAGVVAKEGESLEVALAWRREDILLEVVQAVGTSVAGLSPGWAGRLLDGLVTDLKGESGDVFLQALDDVLRQVMAAGGDVIAWHHALSALRRHLLPYLSDDEVWSRAEDLWRQARVMIGETAQRFEAYQTLQAGQQAQVLREIGRALLATFDVEELMDILAQELPRLGIKRCYLSLYENPAKPVEWSRLILAYDEKERVDLGVGGQHFPSPQLVPKEMLPPEMQYNLIVEPLYFRENQLGFVLFETEPREGAVYEVLRGEISSALQGALLVERRKQAEAAMAKRATELELVARVSAAVSTILDTTELLERVANLTKDSFGLYHAHVYLLDEREGVLVLAAGASPVGPQMVAEGWRIPFRQEQSLVARAARMREGFFVNDVRADPNWLPNPLLPDTKSELAVPLITGERVLGVLDVQADKPDHFTDDDIRIQSTLAAQVTVALENVRLFEQEQASLALTERLYQAGRRITGARDFQEIVAAMAEVAPVGVINRVVLGGFEYDEEEKLEGMIVRANWYSGRGTAPTPVGTRYSRAMFPEIEQFVGSEPMIFGEIQHDERFGQGWREVWQRLNIRAMAVLPLWIGTRQMGVLLLQTEEAYQLSEEEIRPYVSLIGQVAVAIENKRLLAEANAALAEVEATQRRYTVQPWGAYQVKKEVQSYEQAREGVVLTENDLPPVALPTPDNRSRSNVSHQLAAVSRQQNETPSSLVVPLTVRDEVIGVLGFKETKEREWTPNEVALIKAIGEQLARAYENLRLIDETQQRAAREARINEIGEKIRGAQSLEEALQIAIREVGQSLEAPQTAIKLEVSDS